MKDGIAIKVENLSKTFKIPHEKISTLRGAFVNVFHSKGYEKFKALDDVSFEVKKGEFFGIIGRNGSGKSTLLKILAGIYQPDAGRVKIHGRISPFLELGIGFNPELSGRDNIYLNAAVLGLTKKQIDQKLDDIVNFSELRRFIDQKVKNYSSGMQVRLAFSVAIHANRDILLMDEVLAVGDVNFQSKCISEFAKYKRMGKTVILVTHDIPTVQKYCDRAMLLRNGKIQMIGKPMEVGDKYINQNMSDEEKRIMEEDANKKKSERGIAKKEKKTDSEDKKEKSEGKRDKIAEFTKVEFLDKDGNIKNVFQTGDDMSVRVYFKIYKMQDEFNFGLGLCTEDDKYVMGINTIMDKVDTKLYLDKGYLQVDLKKIPIRTGKYYVRVSIVRNNFYVPFDSISKSPLFSVASRSSNKEGLVEIGYNWAK